MKSAFRDKLWIIGIVAVCILIFLGLQNIGAVASAAMWLLGLVSPLLIGLVFAAVLNVPMRFFEVHLWKKTKSKTLLRLRRPVAFILSFILIAGILVGIVWLVIPELVKAFGVAAQGVTAFVNHLTSMSREEIATLPFGSTLLGIDWDNIQLTVQNWLKNQGGNIVSTAFGTVTSLVGGIFNSVLAFVFAIYILFNKEKLKGQLCRLIRVWLPEKCGEWLIHAASLASKSFSNFISGQSIEAVILGILCTLGMYILGIPYAGMVGALVGVTALIPVAGAFIGAGVGAFIILTEAPIKALIFLIFILILQQLEENLIYPKVIGSRMNLSALWILAAITVGGGIAGPLGMLLSVPITSTLYALLKEATSNREAVRFPKPEKKASAPGGKAGNTDAEKE